MTSRKRARAQAKNKKTSFGIPGLMKVRRKELLADLRDIGEQIPDTEQGRKHAQVMAHCIVSSCEPHPERAFKTFCHEWCEWMDRAEIDAIINYAITKPRRFSADKVAKIIDLTAARRERLKITTIGAIDRDKKQRAALRKERRRQADAARRRAEGKPTLAERRARPKSEWWKEYGLSKSQAYKLRAKGRLPDQPASNPLATRWQPGETSREASVIPSFNTGLAKSLTTEESTPPNSPPSKNLHGTCDAKHRTGSVFEQNAPVRQSRTPPSFFEGEVDADLLDRIMYALDHPGYGKGMSMGCLQTKLAATDPTGAGTAYLCEYGTEGCGMDLGELNRALGRLRRRGDVEYWWREETDEVEGSVMVRGVWDKPEPMPSQAPTLAKLLALKGCHHTMTLAGVLA